MAPFDLSEPNKYCSRTFVILLSDAPNGVVKERIMDDISDQGDFLGDAQGAPRIVTSSQNSDLTKVGKADLMVGKEGMEALPTQERVVLLDPTTLKVHPANGRYGVRFDPLKNAELIEDIRRRGQLTPVIVRELSDGTYELVAGTRRHGAVLEVRHQQRSDLKIKAHVRDLSDQGSWEIADAENADRRDLTPMQRARTWNYALREFHEGRQDLLAKAIDKDPSVVCRTLQLLELPTEVLAALRDPEGVSVNFATKLVPSLADPAQRDRIIAIAKHAVSAGGKLSSAVLLKRLLLSPAEIAAGEPISIGLGECERQASFTRSDSGGATLTIRPISNSADEKAKRAFLRQMEIQLRSFLKL